ncbi:MAG: hypothetical protein RL702_1269 [Pseudomonadota bacterium]|jgi:flagellar basal-body rod modification protein FlgD
MTVTSVTSAGQAWSGPAAAKTALGQTDFIRLMTEQMKMQDPMDPVDNKEMVAQMAQFSSLAGIEGINSTLKGIAAQLDQVMAAQTAAAPAPAAASTSDPAANPANA